MKRGYEIPEILLVTYTDKAAADPEAALNGKDIFTVAGRALVFHVPARNLHDGLGLHERTALRRVVCPFVGESFRNLLPCMAQWLAAEFLYRLLEVEERIAEIAVEDTVIVVFGERRLVVEAAHSGNGQVTELVVVRSSFPD